MVYVYVLKLVDGKYYVGKTNNPDYRIESHKTKTGSKWTQIYTPISVVQIYDNCIDFDEDFYTLKYMEKYGINNVRGGSFSQIKLSKEDIFVINKMLKTKNDSCYNCGSEDHFIEDCFANNDYDRLNTNNNNNTNNTKNIKNIKNLFNNYTGDCNFNNVCQKLNNYFYECYLGFKDFICFSQRYNLQGIDLDEFDFSSDDESDSEDVSEDISDDEDVTKNIFTFGKYKGQYFDTIIKTKPGYIDWALKVKRPSNQLKTFINYYKAKTN